IAAGVRRIEAVTGEGALRQYQETAGAVRRLAEMVQGGEPELVEHVEKLLATEHALQKQVEQLKNQLAQAAVGQVESLARSFGEVKVVAARLDGMDRPQMRALADALRNKWKSAVVVLAGAEDGSVLIISAGNWPARWRWRWAAKAAGVPTWRRPAARIPPRSMRRWKRSTATWKGSCSGERIL